MAEHLTATCAPAIDATEVRKGPTIGSRALVAVALAAVVSCELVLGSLLHDAVAHEGGEDSHACVVCLFDQAREVPPPVLADCAAPAFERLAVAGEVTAPAPSAETTPKLARAPPASHA